MNTNVRVGITYIVIAIIFLSYSALLTYQRHNPSRISFKKSPDSAQAVTVERAGLIPSPKQNPVRIKSNTLKFDLPVENAVIRDGQWDLSEQGVSYLQSSPVPGTRGNSILYGHNWPGILGNLTKAKPGDEITVITHGGSERTFTIEKTAILSPDDYTVLNNTADTRITIYTCAGFMDSKRFVATARLSTSAVQE